MSHLTDQLEDLASRLAVAGLPLRVTTDAAAAVPPCLLVEDTPTWVRPAGACGHVWEWTAVLIPAVSTDALAAAWLADTLPAVLDVLDAPTAAVPVLWAADTDGGRAGQVAAYSITYHA